jgi:hypothetical protein
MNHLREGQYLFDTLQAQVTGGSQAYERFMQAVNERCEMYHKEPFFTFESPEYQGSNCTVYRQALVLWPRFGEYVVTIIALTSFARDVMGAVYNDEIDRLSAQAWASSEEGP